MMRAATALTLFELLDDGSVPVVPAVSLVPTMEPLELVLTQKAAIAELSLPVNDSAVIPFRMRLPTGDYVDLGGYMVTLMVPAYESAPSHGPFIGRARALDRTIVDIPIPENSLTVARAFARPAQIVADGPGTGDRHTLFIRLQVLATA